MRNRPRNRANVNAPLLLSLIKKTEKRLKTICKNTFFLAISSLAHLYFFCIMIEIDPNNKWNATLSIMMLSIMALNTESYNAECHLCWVSFMLSVANKPIKLSVIMLSVIMLNVIMMSVVMLSVVAPLRINEIYYWRFRCKYTNITTIYNGY